VCECVRERECVCVCANACVTRVNGSVCACQFVCMLVCVSV